MLKWYLNSICFDSKTCIMPELSADIWWKKLPKCADWRSCKTLFHKWMHSPHDSYVITLVRTIRVIMRKNDARTLHLCKWPHSCAKMIRDWYLSCCYLEKPRSIDSRHCNKFCAECAEARISPNVDRCLVFSCKPGFIKTQFFNLVPVATSPNIYLRLVMVHFHKYINEGDKILQKIFAHQCTYVCRLHACPCLPPETALGDHSWRKK